MHSRPIEICKIKEIIIFDHENKNFGKKLKKNWFRHLPAISSYDVI
jgi:hypothetical protein